MLKKIMILLLLPVFCVLFACNIPKTNAFESVNNDRVLHTFNVFDYIKLNDFILVNDIESFSRNDNAYTLSDNVTFVSSDNSNYRINRYYQSTNEAFSVSYNQYRNQQTGVTTDITKYYFYNKQIIYDLTTFCNFTSPSAFVVLVQFGWNNHSYVYRAETNAFSLTNVIKDKVRADVIEYKDDINNEYDFEYLNSIELNNLEITISNVSNRLSLGRSSNNSNTFYTNFLLEWGEHDVVNPDFTSWLVEGVGAFMNFEIIPGWSIAVILSVMIGIPLLIYVLRLFFGG